ncbi:MAG TPA: hypothetical protein VF786_01930 [Terriglobales bacterium]
MSSKPNVAGNATGKVKPATRRTQPTPRPRKRLPCGATTCLHCHAQCGAAMASYILQDLDESRDT